MAGLCLWLWDAFPGTCKRFAFQQKILLQSVQTKGLQTGKTVTCRNVLPFTELHKLSQIVIVNPCGHPAGQGVTDGRNAASRPAKPYICGTSQQFRVSRYTYDLTVEHLFAIISVNLKSLFCVNVNTEWVCHYNQIACSVCRNGLFLLIFFALCWLAKVGRRRK